MNIRYSIPLNSLIDANGNPLQNLLELAYGDTPTVAFTACDANNTAIDLSGAVTWEFAIDADRDSQTVVLCETSDMTYSAADSVLYFAINTKTLAFLNAVNGKSQLTLLAELSGFDANGTRVYRFPWVMSGVMPVDANNVVPAELPPVVVVQSNDYTGFRVYADDTDDHTQSYAVGSYCPQFVPDNVRFRHTATNDMPLKLQELYANNSTPTDEQIRNALGYIGNHTIPKSMTERFVLLAGTDWAHSDVVVDWGDGTKSYMKNGKTQSARGNGFYDNNEYVDDWEDSHYMFSHTYEQSGSYYVKITGKDYWGIRHYYADLKDATGAAKYPDVSISSMAPYNLVYECLGHDTPIAKCVKNLASFMNCNCRLLHVMWTEINQSVMTDVCNFVLAFSNCRNLVSLRGAYFAGYGLTGNQDLGMSIQNCKSLEIFVGSLPAYCTNPSGLRSVFNGCTKLRANIASILPSGGFVNRRFSANKIFNGCAALTGTVPAELLWGDAGITWSDTSQAFAGCSAAIRAQVPEAWGGTLAEPEA